MSHTQNYFSLCNFFSIFIHQHLLIRFFLRVAFQKPHVFMSKKLFVQCNFGSLPAFLFPFFTFPNIYALLWCYLLFFLFFSSSHQCHFTVKLWFCFISLLSIQMPFSNSIYFSARHSVFSAIACVKNSSCKSCISLSQTQSNF